MKASYAPSQHLHLHHARPALGGTTPTQRSRRRRRVVGRPRTPETRRARPPGWPRAPSRRAGGRRGRGPPRAGRRRPTKKGRRKDRRGRPTGGARGRRLRRRVLSRVFVAGWSRTGQDVDIATRWCWPVLRPSAKALSLHDFAIDHAAMDRRGDCRSPGLR